MLTTEIEVISSLKGTLEIVRDKVLQSKAFEFLTSLLSFLYSNRVGTNYINDRLYKKSLSAEAEMLFIPKKNPNVKKTKAARKTKSEVY